MKEIFKKIGNKVQSFTKPSKAEGLIKIADAKQVIKDLEKENATLKGQPSTDNTSFDTTHAQVKQMIAEAIDNSRNRVSAPIHKDTQTLVEDKRLAALHSSAAEAEKRQKEFDAFLNSPRFAQLKEKYKDRLAVSDYHSAEMFNARVAQFEAEERIQKLKNAQVREEQEKYFANTILGPDRSTQSPVYHLVRQGYYLFFEENKVFIQKSDFAHRLEFPCFLYHQDSNHMPTPASITESSGTPIAPCGKEVFDQIRESKPDWDTLTKSYCRHAQRTITINPDNIIPVL
jgi:hypothetical protein